MGIDISQILFQIVNFSVVLAALTFLLYKPILKMFLERAKRIEEGQKAAAQALSEQAAIDELKAKTETELKKKTAQVLKEASKEAEAVKEKLIAEAHTAAHAEITKMKNAWKTEKTQMIDSIRSEMIASVIAVSEKVIGQSVDVKKHEKLIDTELEAVIKAL